MIVDVCEVCGWADCTGDCEQVEWEVSEDDVETNEISHYCCY